MLFAASILGYLIVWYRIDNSPSAISIDRPVVLTLFLASTAAILASSFTLHGALGAVRRERQSRLRRLLVATLAKRLPRRTSSTSY